VCGGQGPPLPGPLFGGPHPHPPPFRPTGRGGGGEGFNRTLCCSAVCASVLTARLLCCSQAFLRNLHHAAYGLQPGLQPAAAAAAADAAAAAADAAPAAAIHCFRALPLTHALHPTPARMRPAAAIPHQLSATLVSSCWIVHKRRAASAHGLVGRKMLLDFRSQSHLLTKP